MRNVIDANKVTGQESQEKVIKKNSRSGKSGKVGGKRVQSQSNFIFYLA